MLHFSSIGQKIPALARLSVLRGGSTLFRYISRSASTENFAYVGDKKFSFTTALDVVAPEKHAIWPIYRVMDFDGNIYPKAKVPNIDKSRMVDMYKMMVRIAQLDDVFYNAQRQGRISFYMQNSGEEACHIGSAAPLDLDDVVYAQYREVGVLLWRGFSLQDVSDQCFSNVDDLGKGRQMPVHYGSSKLNFQTISSPLATQIPQAAGAGYALKLKGGKNVCICYFGDGAASEGDFHAGLNFAATLKCPTIFFCRNNGYAISTPTSEQYAGDGIISRAVGYGMHGIRVDGNDLFAVYNATKAARDICLSESRPVLIEAMTYRRGHHSTSDDSTRYRSVDQIESWRQNNDPITRFKKYLIKQQLWSDTDDDELAASERLLVTNALAEGEGKPKPDVSHLFTDVYQAESRELKRQQEELGNHMRIHGDKLTSH